MSAGALVLTFPFSLVFLPIAVVSAPIWYWHNARSGWRWWAATACVALGAVVLGEIVVSLILFVVGTGDYRWNIPLATGISIQLLDYLSVAGVAIFATGATGLFVTRWIGATVIVILVGFIAISIAWWFMAQPVHTNDISWTMSTWMVIGFGLTIAISTLIVTRLLRVSGRPANPA